MPLTYSSVTFLHEYILLRCTGFMTQYQKVYIDGKSVHLMIMVNARIICSVA